MGRLPVHRIYGRSLPPNGRELETSTDNSRPTERLLHRLLKPRPAGGGHVRT
jgi:hypothetical protein